MAELEYGHSFHGSAGEITQMYAQVTTSPVCFGFVEPRDPIPDRPTWQIHYMTRNTEMARVDLRLNLDALSGAMLTAVEDVSGEERLLFSRHGVRHE